MTFPKSNKTHKVRRVLLAAVFALLVGGFVAHVRDSLNKFFSGTTTTVTSHAQGEYQGDGVPRDPAGFVLPTVATCPGFQRSVSWRTLREDFDHWPIINYFDSHPEAEGKRHKLQNIFSRLHRLGRNISKEELDFWWSNETTVELGDFLEALVIHSADDHVYAAQVSKNSTLVNDTISKFLAIREVSNTLGRCYLFNAKIKISVSSDKNNVDMRVQYSSISYVCRAEMDLFFAWTCQPWMAKRFLFSYSQRVERLVSWRISL